MFLLDEYEGASPDVKVVKLIVDSPEGVEAVRHWIQSKFRELPREERGNGIISNPDLWASLPGDKDFQEDPARVYMVFGWKDADTVWIPSEDIEQLRELFRKYGRIPHKPPKFQGKELRVDRSRYRAVCQTERQNLSPWLRTKEEATQVGANHERATGHRWALKVGPPEEKE